MTTIAALQASGGFGTAMIIQLVVIVAIFYFLIIMPQRREQKRHKEMLASLAPGERIATAGGVIGEIIQLRGEQVTIKSGDSRLVVERARIARLLRPPVEKK